MQRQSGFTLIELMITVAIVAVLATITAPSLTSFANEMRLASTMSDLSADLYFSRSESIKRNTPVRVCARADATSTACVAPPGDAGAWINGWLVCYDVNSDGCDAPTGPDDPNPMKIHSALAPPLSLTGPIAAVVFFPLGNANAATTFTMTGGVSTTRTANVAASGNVSVTKTKS